MKRKKRKSLLIFLLFIIFIAILSGVFLLKLNETMLPQALAIADMQMKSTVNEAILNAVQETIDAMELTTVSFYKKSVDENGKLNSISVDTLVVNQFCNKIVVQISKEIGEMNKQTIKVPLGVSLGIELLANSGPEYSMTIRPLGNAVVNYESSFESAGINQIHFQLWLNVESTIQVINPLQQNQITVSRKIPLVSTIITGDIPSIYTERKD